MRTLKKEEYTDVLMDSRILVSGDYNMIKDVRLDECMMKAMPIFCEKVGVRMIHMVFKKKKPKRTYGDVYQRIMMDMVSKALEEAVNRHFNDRRPDVVVFYSVYDGSEADVLFSKKRAYDRLMKLRSQKSIDYFDRVNDFVDNHMFTEKGGLSVYPLGMDKCIMVGDLNGNTQDLDWLCSKDLHIPFMDKTDLMKYAQRR